MNVEIQTLLSTLNVMLFIINFFTVGYLVYAKITLKAQEQRLLDLRAQLADYLMQSNLQAELDGMREQNQPLPAPRFH